ncbi:BtrH N-terminal domain-containing protein [Actinokineospora sp.]|uniref:BtrH N-terminal domain-containing protein n=1 Tax=Actinokineospora sp. TaxID=1872133 RepID=UPI0040381A08
MTSKKQLKGRIRARMAKTGERYSTARAHLVGDQGPVLDHGWALRGGVEPESAALVGMLAHADIRSSHELDEPLLFGIGGGIGAGYILWEFKHDDSRSVVLAFTNQWQRIAVPSRKVADRLGIAITEHRTSGAKAAARHLHDVGRPALVWPDRFHIGYWNVPNHLDGHGGHPVVAYAHVDGRVHLDDRNLAPLTVAAADFERARARVGSYQNLAVTIADTDKIVTPERLRHAVAAGLVDVGEHLSQASDSFSLPAWRKWSRMMTDQRAAKAWPKVFADRVGVLDALASVWEAVEPAGMTGGNLRGLFADFLDRAALILDRPALAAEATRWREIAQRWHALAETALPADLPVVERLRTLTATVTTTIGDGDDGADERAEAAAELWALRAEYARTSPFPDIDGVFAGVGAAVAEIHDAEVAGIAGIIEIATTL